MQKLPSKYQIGENVRLFIPGDHLRTRNDTDEPDDALIDGQIVAVRFTKGKVFYDILDDLCAEIFRDMDSMYFVDKVKSDISQV